MKSFRHAWDGVIHAVKTERNMRIHLAAAFYAFLLGHMFGFTRSELALVALACGLVIGAELINTALERLCDGLEPGHSPVIKTVKDLAAGAVLVCAIAAVGLFAALLWRNEWRWIQDTSFYIGAAALPFWGVFVFWFGRKKHGTEFKNNMD